MTSSSHPKVRFRPSRRDLIGGLGVVAFAPFALPATLPQFSVSDANRSLALLRA